MRQSAQFHYETGDNDALHQSALDGALEEMLFSGRSLSVNLLGGSNIGSECKMGLAIPQNLNWTIPHS